MSSIPIKYIGSGTPRGPSDAYPTQKITGKQGFFGGGGGMAPEEAKGRCCRKMRHTAGGAIILSDPFAEAQGRLREEPSF